MKRVLALKKNRIQLIYCIFIAGFTVVAARGLILQVFPNFSKHLNKLASNQYFDNHKLSPSRGTIYDHLGEPLAVGVTKATLFVNPKTFRPTTKELKKIARITGISKKKISSLQKKKGYFAYLKRKVPQDIGDQIIALGIRGLFSVAEPARSYPSGSLAAPLLGFVGIDNQGLGGIERSYEKDLEGDPVKITASKDAKGRPLYLSSTDIQPDHAGNQVYLTIDRAIQRIAESALQKGLENAKSKKGFVVVSDPHTGRLLAVANYPTFDPNKGLPSKWKSTRNSAFLDVFEPASVVKPFVVGVALSQKKTTIDSLHNCEKGKLKIGRHTIHDTKPNSLLSTKDVLIKSSNVCIYKIAQKIGKEALHDGFQKLSIASGKNFDSIQNIPHGRISPWQKWRPIRFANIAFGQGFLTNALEIVTAYNTIANGGRYVEPQIIDKITTADGSYIKNYNNPSSANIMDPQVAKALRTALYGVVEHPSTFRAKMKSYTAAGKTGTAQKADPVKGGYSRTKRIASFAGFAPVEDPYIVIYVNVDEPQGPPYYGSVWAAPIFKEVAENTLKYLNAEPDRPALQADKTSNKKPILKKL